MKVRYQKEAPSALASGKELQVHVRQEGGWTADLILKL